jgi:biotin transport system substrate-specific component
MANKTRSLKSTTLVALFAALTAVLAYVVVPLPFSPVPISGQSLAVMLVGPVLGRSKALASMSVYILLGVAGLPVFSGGRAGIGTLLGPTGGYIVGFAAGAWVTGSLWTRDHKRWRLWLALVVGGVLVVATFGAVHLSVVTDIGIRQAIVMGVLPFIPGDLLKVSVAYWLLATRSVQRLMRES